MTPIDSNPRMRVAGPFVLPERCGFPGWGGSLRKIVAFLETLVISIGSALVFWPLPRCHSFSRRTVEQRRSEVSSSPPPISASRLAESSEQPHNTRAWKILEGVSTLLDQYIDNVQRAVSNSDPIPEDARQQLNQGLHDQLQDYFLKHKIRAPFQGVHHKAFMAVKKLRLFKALKDLIKLPNNSNSDELIQNHQVRALLAAYGYHPAQFQQVLKDHITVDPRSFALQTSEDFFRAISVTAY